MLKITDLEMEVTRELAAPLREILRKFNYSLNDQYHVQVSLLDAKGRKKRSSAAASNWSAEGGRIEIRFELISPHQKQRSSEAPAATEDGRLTRDRQDPQPASITNTYLHSAEGDLLKSLDRAESRPGWSFVPLKKFRDEILPQEHFTSMPNTDVARHSVLQSVIDKRFVLVGKVPNPRSPQFPVTTIRLNRLMPEVKEALGLSGTEDLDFHPVEIRGEPLSTTILRDRR